MDFETGTYDFLNSTQFTGGSSIANAPTSTGFALAPGFGDYSGGGTAAINDSIGPGSKSVPYDYYSGISGVLDGVAAVVGAFNGPGGTVIGTDRNGGPLYRVVDPRTGAVYTSASPTWGGSPGAPSQYPERNILTYNGVGGPWGWLTNLLALPAPAPKYSIGTVPGLDYNGDPQLSQSVTGGPSSPLIPLVIIGILAVIAVKYVAK